MLTGHVAVNGKITSANEAKISVFDRGYLYGDGLMEVMYAYRGEVVAAALHLERLYAAADSLNINLPWQQSQLLTELQQLASYYESCYLRLTISSGVGVGIARKHREPQRTVICLPYQRPRHSHPLTVKSKHRSANFANNIKTLDYLESIVALEKEAQGGDDILWLTAADMIAETTAANIFFLKATETSTGNRCWNFSTPANTGDILVGVTRLRMCQYIKQQGHTVSAKPIAYRELEHFNAAFITSAVQGARLLKRIDEYDFNTEILNDFCQAFNQSC